MGCNSQSLSLSLVVGANEDYRTNEEILDNFEALKVAYARICGQWFSEVPPGRNRYLRLITTVGLVDLVDAFQRGGQGVGFVAGHAGHADLRSRGGVGLPLFGGVGVDGAG